MEPGAQEHHVVELEMLDAPPPPAPDVEPEPPAAVEERRVGRVLVAVTALVIVSLLAGVDYDRLLGRTGTSPPTTTPVAPTGGTDGPGAVLPGARTDPVEGDTDSAAMPLPMDVALGVTGEVVTLAAHDGALVPEVVEPGGDRDDVIDVVVRDGSTVVLDRDGAVAAYPSGRSLGHADRIVAAGAADQVWIIEGEDLRLVDLDGEQVGSTIRIGPGAVAVGATADGLVVRDPDGGLAEITPSGSSRDVPDPMSYVASTPEQTLRGGCSDEGVCELWLADAVTSTGGRDVPVPAGVRAVRGAGASISPGGEQVAVPVEVHDPGSRGGRRTALLAVDLGDGRSVLLEVPYAGTDRSVAVGEPAGTARDDPGTTGANGPGAGDATEPGGSGVASSWSTDGDWLLWTDGTKLWAGRPGLGPVVELATDLDPLHALALGAEP